MQAERFTPLRGFVGAAAVCASEINGAQIRAAKAARNNPDWHESRKWMAEKIMAFLDEQGMLTWYTRPIYQVAHLI